MSDGRVGITSKALGLTPRDVTRWIEKYRQQWERRLDRLEAYIEKRKGEAK